jgi:flagellar protein FlaG
MTSISSITSAPPSSAALARSVISSAATRSAGDAPEQSVAPVVAPVKATATESQIKQITEELQRRVAALAPELQFSVDQSSGETIVKFTDPTTNEVIQQFPSEALIQIGKALDQFQKGLLLNRKA